MYISRGLISSSPVERVHIGNDTTQPPVFDIFSNKLISCHHEVFGMGKKSMLRRPEVEQVHFFRDGIDGLHVMLQILALGWKLLGQRIDKSLASLCYSIISMILSKIKTVGTFSIHVHQPHLVENAQIPADTTDVSSFLHATDDMHTRIKTFTKTMECLKTASNGHVLFEHSYLQPFFGQNSSCEKAAEASAYDDD